MRALRKPKAVEKFEKKDEYLRNSMKVKTSLVLLYAIKSNACTCGK